MGAKKTKEDRKAAKAAKHKGEENGAAAEAKEEEAKDDEPEGDAPAPAQDDDDDDGDWSVDTSAEAVAARMKLQEEAYSKVEKAAGHGEELDEFEQEKKDISDKIIKALGDADSSTDDQVKALQAIAKEHKLGHACSQDGGPRASAWLGAAFRGAVVGSSPHARATPCAGVTTCSVSSCF